MAKLIKYGMAPLALAIMLGAGTVAADPRGEQVMRDHVAADLGWTDMTASATMELVDRNGTRSVREMAILMLENTAGGDKSLTVFQRPADVLGTAFLSHAKLDEADDQWLYLPTLSRTKRIASVNKSGPFLGSEFSYEDISAFEFEKYDYTFVGEETIADRPHHIVEMRPRYEHSGYNKIIVAVDGETHVFRQLTFYDRKGQPFKVQENTEFEQHLDRYWRPRVSQMRNLRTGKETWIRWSEYTFQVGLSEGDFVAERLRRAAQVTR